MGRFSKYSIATPPRRRRKANKSGRKAVRVRRGNSNRSNNSFIVSDDDFEDDETSTSDDDDDDDYYSDGSLDGEEGELPPNTALLSGPTGVGKTATVHALARQLGFKVLEVNASSLRGGRQVRTY